MQTKRNAGRYLPATLMVVLLAATGWKTIDRQDAVFRERQTGSFPQKTVLRSQMDSSLPTNRSSFSLDAPADSRTVISPVSPAVSVAAHSQNRGNPKPGFNRPSGKDGRTSNAQKKAKEKKQKDKEKKPLLAKFMRAKLTASSQILEGLCTEDYDLIIRGAKALRSMSSAEAWRVSNDAMYRQHSAEFRRVVDQLLKAGQNQKIDSAALAWTKTTLSCIECHRWVRAMLISQPGR